MKVEQLKNSLEDKSKSVSSMCVCVCVRACVRVYVHMYRIHRTFNGDFNLAVWRR